MEEEKLILFRSNGEVDLEARLPARTEGEGRLLVSFRPFFELVWSLLGETVVPLRT